MRTQKGFTLIELMIVVVVVSILAAIAVPSYRSSMLKTRRATAAACLLELSQYMERAYTKDLDYTKAVWPALAADGTDTRRQCQRDLADHYSFSLDPNVTAQRKYRIKATPQGGQTADPCGTLTIDHAGTKGAGGGASSCWK
jgi:type IV pilus assembly protein PilE